MNFKKNPIRTRKKTCFLQGFLKVWKWLKSGREVIEVVRYYNMKTTFKTTISHETFAQSNGKVCNIQSPQNDLNDIKKYAWKR